MADIDTTEMKSDFLREEVRNDWHISVDTKKLWFIEMELLESLISVCKEHGLKYWAYAGSLLGAIRHKGFIPWDDDLDVVMPRADYEILLSHPEWFELPVQLHIPNNAEGYYEGWIRLQNVETACVHHNAPNKSCKQGIYIDIFPLDNISGIEVFRKDAKKIKRINVIGHAISFNVNPNIILKTLHLFNGFLKIFKPLKLFKKINRIATKENHINTENVGVKVLSVYDCRKKMYKREWFDKTVEVPYEYLNISVPAAYDDILKVLYGDYMAFPPESERGKWHNFDYYTDSPYSEFNKK